MSEDFSPTRTAGLERLARFVPLAGRTYAQKRNFDLGPGQHVHVSILSPYLRHRLITEEEVLQAVLARHSLQAAEKFVQEVFWRTYWKGWLEMRPGVWNAYQAQRDADWNAVQTQSGLRRAWEDACTGQTGIDAFDAWAGELVETGYLHNHARMWFASIWIFTLGLPWTLGADLFLRHLLDGDVASNTLGWRWVAGLQTPGKTYLARPSNIAQFTNGRFEPNGLATAAPALPFVEPPARKPIAEDESPAPDLRTGFLMTPDDLSPGFVLQGLPELEAAAMISNRAALSHLEMSPHVLDWERRAMEDVAERWQSRLGEVERIDDPLGWAREHGLEQIVTAYAPVGPEAAILDQLAAQSGIRIVRMMRPYDHMAWPKATHGFFRFKENIPGWIATMRGLQPV